MSLALHAQDALVVVIAQQLEARADVVGVDAVADLSLIHISEPTRLLSISYAVFCLKKKNKIITTTILL